MKTFRNARLRKKKYKLSKNIDDDSGCSNLLKYYGYYIDVASDSFCRETVYKMYAVSRKTLRE